MKIAAAFLVLAIIWGIARITLTYGPLSQASLIQRHESANLAALVAADLPILTNLPVTDITYMEPYRPIPGFKPPWSSGLFLSILRLQNGPLEGQSSRDTIYGLRLTNGYMIATHAWFNARDWGLYYSKDHTPLPIPYWSKRVTGDWQAWYLHHSSTPQRAGMWYE